MLVIFIDDLEKGHVVTTLVLEGSSDLFVAQLIQGGTAVVAREAVENAEDIRAVVDARVEASDAARENAVDDSPEVGAR